jgi:beta-aspartyl-peptidase (threonine type)
VRAEFRRHSYEGVHLRPALVVHGGAWEIPVVARKACRAGCRRAFDAGQQILDAGGSSIDAVEAAIVALEEDPVFDAGFGSHLNLRGRVQLDAILMDGSTLDAGAVAAVERIRNPIRLARRVLQASPHVLLAAEGAEEFAREQGMPLCRQEDLITESQRAAWQQCCDAGHTSAAHFAGRHGTVGAVAVDASGRIAAGTSTGGTCCKYPGRVGDSPLIGCGCYADDEVGGASSTGWGEAIMKIVMAKTAIDWLRAGDPPQEVADRSIRLLADRAHGTGGLILIDRQGRIGTSFSTSRMAFAYRKASGEFALSP